MIDLRSDTVTKPTKAMLAAMAGAEVGDEQFHEDPTVNELQRRTAELLGAEAAWSRGASVHLDGARLFNASVAAGIPAAEWGRLADSVTVCFSKGLGCPLGAVLAGSADVIERAWQGKFLFGGAMRQAGVIAAAALYALDHHVERLAEDHARARRLGEGLAAAGLAVDLDALETNFVGIGLEPTGLDDVTALAR